MRRIRAGAAGCAVMLAATLAAAGCGGSPSPAPTATGGRAAFVGVADDDWADAGMADASVRVGARMVSLGGGQNIVVSPVGLQAALAVLRDAATGAAAAQLDDVLGLPGSDGRKVADLLAVLGQPGPAAAPADAASLPTAPLLHLADALFVQSGFDVGGGFEGRTAAFYDTQLLDADFAAATAQPVLDAWVAAGTGGVFPQAPVAPTADVRMVLATTATFEAPWAQPFATAATVTLPFTLADGTAVAVPMMSGTVSTSYAEAEGWRACEVPFADGIVMRVAITAAGGSPDWVTVADGLAQASEQSVHLVMPRWTTATSVDLLPFVKGLGVGGISRPGNLDDIADGAFVSGVAHSVVLRIAEAGAVLVGATGDAAGDAAPVAAAVELLLDRPFEYQVVHEATGMVLFAGRVANPSI